MLRIRESPLGILRPVHGLPDQLRWLLTGTPPSRIGFSPGPLTDLRKARHALGAAARTRPLRLCLLEHDTSTMYLAEPTAFWINQRSRVCWAERNGPPERADLVWVFTQDPLGAEVRAWLAGQLRRVRPGVPVLNPPAVHDAYHDPDCFDRLARAGVCVPRTAFGPADLGVTPVVYKAVGEQAARKERCRYDGPRPGFRAAVAHDSRGPDGRYRRYRAFVLGDLVLPEDVLVADHWNASLRHLVTVERNYVLTGFERAQLRLITATLGLDFACVDYLRERDGGAPVFHDINVYPTVVGAWQGDMAAGDRGRWHVFDNCARLGLAPPGGRPVWRQVDEELVKLASGPRPAQPGSPRRFRLRITPRSTSATAAIATATHPITAEPAAKAIHAAPTQNTSPNAASTARSVSALRAGVEPPMPAVGSWWSGRPRR